MNELPQGLDASKAAKSKNISRTPEEQDSVLSMWLVGGLVEDAKRENENYEKWKNSGGGDGSKKQPGNKSNNKKATSPSNVLQINVNIVKKKRKRMKRRKKMATGTEQLRSLKKLMLISVFLAPHLF